MTNRNHRIRRFITMGLAALCFGAFAGCSQIDVDTEEGLHKALDKREKLDKAIPKISGMVSRPEELKPYVPALKKLYQDGSSFDREVIQALAAAASVGEDVNAELEKAIASKDYKQIIQAAYGVKASKNPQLQAKLLDLYDKQINPEVQRVIIETGLTIKSDAITDKALDILNGKTAKGGVDETPFVLLQASCKVLEFQRAPKAVDTILRMSFYSDSAAHSLSPECTAAFQALDKDVAAPVLLSTFKLENKDIMDFVAAHPDSLTKESVINNTATMLAVYRYTEAVGPMLDYLKNTKMIPVPGTLALKPNIDPAWQMWAGLTGVASQSVMFALNDIGLKGHAEAKEILLDIFGWTAEYQRKFKNAIELAGAEAIEVSQRVNAFRLLRENGLINDDEVKEMIDSFSADEFKDKNSRRDFVRANIATDFLTYSAITSHASDLKNIWEPFDKLRAGEDSIFYLPKVTEDAPKDDKPAAANDDAPAPTADGEANAGDENAENADAAEQEQKKEEPKITEDMLKGYANYSIYHRIDDTKAAFELANRCDTNVKCYADALNKEGLTDYERYKIIYELGLSGDHQYFETICEQYSKLDVLGQQYGAPALANLGTKDDIPRVEKLIKDLSRAMNGIQFQAAKPALDGLLTTLRVK